MTLLIKPLIAAFSSSENMNYNLWKHFGLLRAQGEEGGTLQRGKEQEKA